MLSFAGSLQVYVALDPIDMRKGFEGLYAAVSEKLKAVEAEADDAEVVAIRHSLDDLLALAKNGKQDLLAAQAERLKSSFIKVYLQRG